MAGQLRDLIWLCLLLSMSAVFCLPADAQPRESRAPIGGITFEPPRPALVRHKGGQVIRGLLIAISPDLVQIRLNSGKEFQYEIREIRSIITSDREFRYTTAHDTYREAVEKASGLKGVTVEAIPATVDVTTMPQPPPPPMPVVLDSPNNYDIPEIVIDNGPATSSNGSAQVAQIPDIPQSSTAPQAGAVATAPFYETDEFKIIFIIACLVIILLWWRNRVG